MSAGKPTGESPPSGRPLTESPPSDLDEPLADAVADDEAVRFSWSAADVRWANERTTDVLSAAAFAATDRRIVFATDGTVHSIDYDRLRAVKTDPGSAGPDLSTAFLACGGVGLLVGVVAATNDVVNGAGLVALSVALLAVGSATGDSARSASVTIIVGNERQRLTFSADEDVGAALASVCEETGAGQGRRA